VYALVTSGVEVTVVNRTESRAVELAEQLNLVLAEGIVKPIALDSADAARAVREADLLVNCTPVGMYPHIDAQPIPSEWLHEDLFVFDQVYNPLETNLLKAARSAGAGHANGIKMLVFQGALSFEIWTGQAPPVKAMEEAVIRGLQTQPSV
jgi:shikimate dehydrogenase